MWTVRYEQRAAALREKAEPPMRRSRTRKPSKYAGLEAIRWRLTRLTSTLDPAASFTVWVPGK